MTLQHLMIPDLVYDPTKNIVGFNHQFTASLVTILKRLVEEATGDYFEEGSLMHAVCIHLNDQIFKHPSIFFSLDYARRLVETAEQFLEVFRKKTKSKSEFEKVLDLEVETLDLSVRTYNCLKNAQIENVSMLVQKTEGELLRVQNFGRKSLNELRNILNQMDLVFDMKIKDEILKWPGGREEQIFEWR